jgi:hypothetical protein
LSETVNSRRRSKVFMHFKRTARDALTWMGRRLIFVVAPANFKLLISVFVELTDSIVCKLVSR